ncbi:hypothetical protein [Microbacterium sp. KNMS]
MSDKVGDLAEWLEQNPGWQRIVDYQARHVGTFDYAGEWPAPDYWCTVCDRGAEGCGHAPKDAEGF